ncbi:hypothetical protein IFM89_036888 [Coptis chinensis]|uniref:Peptidase A1 domain-containing protein n=1 Tax=Coptis chinensis TaxID=261450 RepID=A0A835M1Q9_9MAGN|nr:hypothetical protein IFM89_036888 [Coptis chinensis]
MDITIDTGSDVTWIQCAPCVNCYRQTDPIFDPAMSHTFEPLACDSQQCNQLQDEKFGCTSTNTCVYKVRYGDGSFTKGDLLKETLSFGVSNIAIGCGLDS